MKVFICHSSRDKPLIREIRNELPKRINEWLDEDALLLGKPISETLERVIKDEADYVVLFVSSDSLKSAWVQQELAWAFEKERETKREFILPVVIEDIWEQAPEGLRNRNYLKLPDSERASVRALAERLRDQLDELAHAELARLQKPAESAGESRPAPRPLAQPTAAGGGVFLSIEIVQLSRSPAPLWLDAIKRAFCSSGARILEDEEGLYLIHHAAPRDAVASAMQSIPALVRELNADLSDTPVFFRVGMDYSKAEATRRRQACPVGNIAIAEQVRRHLGPWRDLFRPSLTGEDLQYVLCQRPLAPQEEPFIDRLSFKQLRALPAMRLINWGVARPTEGLASLAARLHDDSVIVFGDTSWSSRGTLLSAATSDAVGMTEAMAPRSDDNLRVGIDEWEDTADLVASRNTLIVGSGATNLYALVLNNLFAPLRFAIAEGRAMDCISAGPIAGSHREHFGPHTGEGVRIGQKLTDCAGLLIGVKNFFNPEKAMIWAAGINGMGTQAAAALLKDLLQKKVRLPDSVVGCVVTPDAPDDALRDYYRRLRVSNYRIVYCVDADGTKVRI